MSARLVGMLKGNSRGGECLPTTLQTHRWNSVDVVSSVDIARIMSFHRILNSQQRLERQSRHMRPVIRVLWRRISLPLMRGSDKYLRTKAGEPHPKLFCLCHRDQSKSPRFSKVVISGNIR